MTKWQRMVQDMLDAGESLYQIAKRCAKLDRNKVKRWRDGISIPDADEGPLLEQMHEEYASRETRDVASRDVMTPRGKDFLAMTA